MICPPPCRGSPTMKYWGIRKRVAGGKRALFLRRGRGKEDSYILLRMCTDGLREESLTRKLERLRGKVGGAHHASSKGVTFLIIGEGCVGGKKREQLVFFFSLVPRSNQKVEDVKDRSGGS